VFRPLTHWSTIAPALLGSVILCACHATAAQEARLDVAQYSERDELLLPLDTAQWVHLGSSLGSDYSTDEFHPENPGVFGVVQMEPSAFSYLADKGEYADGTMILLSFYSAESASDPELRGFVQGDLLQQEIHVIDRVRFEEEGRAFFVFRLSANRADPLPVGSECHSCHMEHGAFDGTFTQFYPTLRGLVPGPD
jgi:hypothetical protein